MNTTKDSFISYQPLAANFEFIQVNGIEQFVLLESAKWQLLAYLIDNYDDGRSRRFYCLSCQILPLNSLKRALEETEASFTGSDDIKEKAGAVRAAIINLAKARRIDLRLRK